MTQHKIQGDQLDLSLADGSVLSGVDADLLQGNNGAFYQNASNLNAGTVPAARLSGTYGISISGNAATATLANDSTFLGGFAAGTYAQLNSPALTGNPTAPTPAPTDNDTSIATTAFVTNAVSGSASVEFFESPLIVPSTAYGTLVGPYNHGFTGTPDLAQIVLVNVISQFGFNPGEEVILNPSIHDFDEGGGAARTSNLVVFSSTQLWGALAVGGPGISGKTAGVGAWNTITPANWLLRFRVVKF